MSPKKNQTRKVADPIRSGMSATLKNLGYKFETKELVVSHNKLPSLSQRHTPTFYLPDHDVYIDVASNTTPQIEDMINNNSDGRINYVVIRHALFCNITKSDLLKSMLFHQKIFTSNYRPSVLSLPEKEALTKEMVLCLADETFELLRECNWKTHKKTRSPINMENLTEEIVDIFKFLLNIVNVWDIDPDTLSKAFDAKTKKTWDRIRSNY